MERGKPIKKQKNKKKTLSKNIKQGERMILSIKFKVDQSDSLLPVQSGSNSSGLPIGGGATLDARCCVAPVLMSLNKRRTKTHSIKKHLHRSSFNAKNAVRF